MGFRLQKWPARAALAGALLAAALGRTGQAQGGSAPAEDPLESRPFSIPDKQGARMLYDEARAHVEAGRWTEAVTAVGRLIDEFSDAVIALPLSGETPPRSVQAVWRGAAPAARELLDRLPEAARRAASERFGALANTLLDRSARGLDRTALADLAQRYPLTDAAARAWFALGDLEAEAGDLEAARVAWARARRDGLAAQGAFEARRAWLDDAGVAARNSARSTSLGDGHRDDAIVPGSDAHAWENPLRPGLDGPSPLSSTRISDYFNSFPIVADGMVFASDSLSLLAADALTGRARWHSAEHPVWEVVRAGGYVARDRNPVSFGDFFQGLDREGLMLAPAAGSGVVVCPLQVPFTANGNTTFQGQIQITTVIPDRRLFAFDMHSGAPLWNHAPPPLWDCDSGDFTTRMRVAGPPVIAGSRVVVPMWRPQGRIAYHVACYDLHSGAYLWSTQVISGQRPLNMFGRQEREFCAPPLVVVGEKVIALTQLGALAALDLFSGELLWQTVYDQVALPAADGMQAAHRQMHWRNAPPVVEGGVIVATPLDSPDMIGVDLESGAVLWSLGAGRVGRPRGTFNQPWYLMGAVGDTVYLGGRYVVARRARGGLTDQRGPTEEVISEGLFGDGHSDAARLPRGILSAGHVIVPTRDRRVALDRRNLELEDPRVSGDWGGRSSGYGNLALGGGALVALSSGELSGVLEWSSVERLLEEELARHPEDAVAAVRLGEFLRERAARDLAEARFQGALAYLARAHRVLEKPLAAGRPEARLAEFEALRLEARVLTMEVQGGQALEPLERAVELAPDGPRLARVLAEFARAAQGRKPERFEAALARLDRECGDLEFPVEEHLPLTGARNVRRWVIEQRISDAATRGDFGREFAALVDLLDRCGDAPLSESEVPGETPTQRIGRRLAAGARERAAWQPFEERAREALTTARTSGDGAMLDRLLLVYPHTQAASQARDARLRLALAAGDAEGAMRTVFGELPRDWHAGNSTAREAQLLWLGARALGAAGNPLYTASVLQRLARELPDVQADSESPGVTFGSLARLPENLAGDAGGGPGAEDDGSHFDSPAAEVFRREGDLVLLGRLDLGGRRVCVLGGRDSLSALNPDGTLLWSRALGGLGQGLSWGQSARLIQGTPATAAGPGFGGRIVIGWRRGLFAVDGTTGLDAWSWSIAGNLEGAVGSDAGVVIASASPEGAQRTLVGLDAARGIELWRRPVEAGQWPQPVLGGGLGVLLPRSGGSRDAAEGSSGQDAVVFELATGTLVRAVELGAPAAPEDRKAAWIEEGRLVLPRFGRSRENQDALTAFDLEGGARAWRVPVDGTRTLDSIVRCKGQCYLVYLVSGPGSADGGLVELDTRLGATRPVPGVKLGPEDLPIGLKSSAVTELDEPFLFVRRAAPGGKETLVRAIHLPYGQRWAYRLPIPGGALYPGSFPLPAVTSRLVLLVYTDDPEVQGGRGQPSTQMVALDRESGSHRELRLLVDMGRSESIELATLENLLIVCGKGLVLALSGPTGEEQR